MGAGVSEAVMMALSQRLADVIQSHVMAWVTAFRWHDTTEVTRLHRQHCLQVTVPELLTSLTSS